MGGGFSLCGSCQVDVNQIEKMDKDIERFDSDIKEVKNDIKNLAIKTIFVDLGTPQNFDPEIKNLENSNIFTHAF